ncbi:MAG: 4-(cytidine 5'-diphospho)-2-C-methyl-D-erythritol kinase [Phycisphaeraceae bacterium]
MPSAHPPETLTRHCPAKVNLALAVGSPDATGYHPIASWMAALAFSDTLTLQRRADTNESRFDIRFAADAPRPGPIDWPLADDLACRAHRQLEQALGRALSVIATLEKRIPTGAGLGGGSSDAAAMLVGLNDLFELNLSAQALRDHAAALGSDVPFLVAALRGTPSAITLGRGERLEPAPLSGSIHLALVLPALACATGAVYRAFDQRAGHNTADEARVRAIIHQAPHVDAVLFNDLAEPACIVCPELRAARQSIADTTRRLVHITGSGAAMFLLAQDADDARTLAQHITIQTGHTTVPTHTFTI